MNAQLPSQISPNLPPTEQHLLALSNPILRGHIVFGIAPRARFALVPDRRDKVLNP